MELNTPVNWEDSTYSLDERVRSYLDINCGHCHSSTGGANSTGLYLDLTEVRPKHLGINKKPVATGRGSGGYKYSIFPGKSEESILLHPVFAMLAYRQPIRLNVSVLNASRHVGGAQRLAILLERQQRRRIEQRVGMRLEVINISSVQEQMILPRTKIYYRPNMLKSAVTLADIIPGEQIVEPMPLNRGTKPTTDVEIYVGQNFE